MLENVFWSGIEVVITELTRNSQTVWLLCPQGFLIA